MHQRNQNKKLFDLYMGKLSSTRIPNYTPTDQIWKNDYEVHNPEELFLKARAENLFFQNQQIKK